MAGGVLGQGQLALAETPSTQAATILRQVLVLNSYHPGYLWTDQEMKGIFGVLQDGSGEVELRVEYMDWRHFPTESHLEHLRELYQAKYSGVPLEALIVTDDIALEFALKHRDLFHQAPIVFCGINRIKELQPRLPREVTGVAETLDVAGTLATAVRLCPGAKQVLLIVDETDTGQALHRQMEEALRPYAGKLELRFCGNVTLEELLRQVGSFPADGIILLGAFHRDREGRFIGSEQLVQAVTSRAEAPTFHLWDFGMGHGVVGGHLLSGEYQGQRAGEMALRILRGTPVSELPIEWNPPAPPVFDDRELQRFGISVNRLPPESTILYKPVSLYTTHRGLVWSAVGLALIMFVAILVLLENIRRRKQAEGELRMAKNEAEAANRAKDRFLAMLSHELRTPLTPLLLTVEELHADMGVPEEVRRQLADVRRSAELEARLIDDLLDISRITAGKFALRSEVVDLHAAARSVTRIFEPEAGGKHLTLTLELAADLHFVQGDLGRLEQVLWNLLKNAIKFTPERGTITVRSYNIARAADDSEPHCPRDRVAIEVRDTGIGMDAAQSSRIFEMFHQGDPSVTRQFGGLGLGLSIAKAIVDRHGGTITAASEGRGRGAAFTVTLPTIPAPATRASAAAPPRRLEAESLRILLVEDNESTGRVLAKLLKKAGYEVRWAQTLAAAKDLLDREPFQVLLSDIGLPDGSGIELGQYCRSPDGPYGIALSGLGMEQDIAESKAAGFHDHLIKPVTLAALELAIARSGEIRTPSL